MKELPYEEQTKRLVDFSLKSIVNENMIKDESSKRGL